MSTTQKQIIITLLEKPGKDNCNLNGWRPISLINVDTKVIGKMLVNRIKKFLPRLINADQSAFVEGRYIGDPLRITSDMLEYLKSEKLPGILA